MSLVVAPTAASRNVTFRTDDGVTLAGTWYEPSARAGPAVILVHMLHRSRRDWDALATGLASEGVGVLAFDLRGHGESTGTIPPDGQFAPFQQDLAAARRFVASRADVIPHRVGVAGASLGAAIAALDAAQNPGVQSLALLSASTEYRGLRIDGALKKYRGVRCWCTATTIRMHSDRRATSSSSQARIRRPARPSCCTMPDTAPPCSQRTRPWFPR